MRCLHASQLPGAVDPLSGCESARLRRGGVNEAPKTKGKLL